MRRRKIWLAVFLLVAMLVIGTALLLRARAAPEAARLLPEAEAYVYLDLHAARLASDFTPRPVEHEPDYEQFVRDTGFQFERDLDEAAIAVHHSELSHDNGVQLMERRFSEIFVGHYDAVKVRAYLHSLATSTETYRQTDIFYIPHEGRIVRAALLSADTVAVSNTGSADAIHGIIERYRQVALPFGGPELVRDHYRDVPLGSVVWVISQLRTPDGKSGSLPMPGGIGFSLPADSTVVASVRYLGTLQLRLEAITPDDAAAERLNGSASQFLALFRSIETSTQPSGSDADVKAFLQSLRLKQNKSRVVLTAEIPRGFVKKLLTEAPESTLGPAPPPVKQPAEKPTDRSKKKK